MTFLSQTDERWKLKRINGTTSTLNSYGCLVVDITWILNQAGYVITPDELASNYPQLFDGAYWKGWTELEKFFPNVKYAWGERCTDYPAPIEKIVKELDDGYYPIIMLDYSPKVTGLQTHYVVVLGHDDKNNLKIGDPIDGQIVWLDSRYGELDEKYKILKIDVFHHTSSVAAIPDLWEKVKNLLTEENNFSEGDVREMVDWFKQKDDTQRVIRDITDSLTAKQNEIEKKKQIIFELTNEMDGLRTNITHYREFQDKLASILDCTSEQGEILAEVVTATGNESKLVSCLTEKENILGNIATQISQGIEKGTYELRVRVAQIQLELDRKNRDITSYQKKIDLLTLGKTLTQTPFWIKVKTWITALRG